MKKVYLSSVLLLCFAFSIKAQLSVFTDDYASGVSFVPFGGSTNSLSIDNTQSHSGTSSLKIPVTSGYTGGALVIAAPADLSGYTAVTFWAKNDNPAFKLDGVGLGNNAATTKYAVERNGVVLTSGWVKYYIPIPVPSKLTAETGLFHFAEGSGEGAYNIWIDDIQYENVSSAILGTPTAALATETISKAVGETFNPNGTVSVFPICAEGAMQTARAYFTWASSNTAAATINADGLGTAVAQGTTNITGKLGTIDAAGTLTVNVTAALQEPTIAAPTPPARNATDVISVFSGAYTDLSGTDFNPNWGQSTIVSEVNIAGNPTKKYASLNYQGVQFASAIDASQMEKLHIDVWTPNCTEFDVYPIVSGQPEQYVRLTPTFNGWNSFDIDLSQYTIPLNAIIQFKFVGNPFGSSTVFYDNLYFYKAGSGPTAPTTAAPEPTQNAANVISLFSNVYTNVPVDTWSAVWDNADVADVQIAGNDNKLYTNLVFAGIEFTSNTINATDMGFLHVDIWTPNATNFNIKLVDFGANNAYAGGDDTESELSFTPAQGSWVSYDINLNDFTGLASRAHLAQLLFISSASTVYVDNVYFYRTGTTPVRLSEFKVNNVNNTVILQWTTEYELNNKGFSIERSADGRNWQQIAFVNGSNGGAIVKKYSITDIAPVKGINFYRIKQEDFNGSITYSFVQKIDISNIVLNQHSLFPNPAKDRVTIKLGAIESNNTHYDIISPDGRIVKTAFLNKNRSNTLESVNVSGLSGGVYIFRVIDGNAIQTIRFILN